jgi:ribosomal protein L16 Arg81 hydroxylase
MKPTDLLDVLFTSPSRDEFLEGYFPNRPVACHGPVERFDAVLSREHLETVDRYVAASGQSRDAMSSLNVTTIEPLADSCEPWLAALASEIGMLREELDCVAMFGPTGHGVGSHLDGNEVLTLQLCGRKEWRIEADADLPMPNRTRPDDRPSGMSPRAMHFILEPGSVAFIPRGWWHATRPLEDSLSLNIEIRPDCWAAFLTRMLVKRLLNEPEFRRPVLMGLASQRADVESKLPEYLGRAGEVLRELRVPDRNPRAPQR